MEESIKTAPNIPGAENIQTPEVGGVDYLNSVKTYPLPLTNLVDNIRRQSEYNEKKAKIEQTMVSPPPPPAHLPSFNTTTKPLESAQGGTFLDKVIEESGKGKWGRYTDTKRSEIFDTLNSGQEVAMYNQGYYDRRDNNEYYAKRQTTGEKWSNGFKKFIGKTLAGVGGNILGTAYGLGKAAVTMDFEATYNNEFLKYMDDLNTRMDYALPNLYTQAERDLSLTAGMGTANFWADKVLGGAQFTASTILSEVAMSWMTGGTSLATLGARAGLARAGANVQKLEKFDKAVKAAGKEAAKMGSSKTLKKLSNLTDQEFKYANRGYKLGKAAGTARYLAQSAAYESGFETRMYDKEMRTRFKQEYPEATIDEINKFEDNLELSKAYVFGSNMFIVGSSNWFGPMAKVLGRRPSPSYMGNAITRNLLGAGGKEVEGKFVATIAKNWQKALRAPAFMIKSAVPEALEEGGQGLTTLGAEKWLFKSMTDDNISTLSDIMSTTIDSMAEYVKSKEGREEMLIGALIGALMGGGHSLKSGNKLTGDYSAMENKAKALEVFVKDGGERTQTLEHLIYGNQQLTHTQDYEEAKENGDFDRANSAVEDSILTALNRASQLEYLDQTIEEMRDIIASTEIQQIMEAYGFTEGQEQEAINIREAALKEFDKTAKSYKKYKDFVEQYFGEALTQDEKELISQPDNANHMDNMKSMVTYALVKGEGAYEKMRQANNDILSHYSNLFGDETVGTVNLLQELEKERGKKEKTKSKLVTKFDKLSKELEKKEKTRRDMITNNKVSLGRETKRTEGMNKLSLEIEEIQKQQDALIKELNSLLKIKEMGVTTDIFSETDTRDYVTKEDLNNISKVIENLESLTKDLNDTDAIKSHDFYRLNRAFEDFHRSLSSYEAYSEILSQMRSGKLQLTGTKGLYGKVTKYKPNENTQKFIQALLKDYGIQVKFTQEATVQRSMENARAEEEGYIDSEGKPTVKKFRPPTKKDPKKEPPKNLREYIKQLVDESPYIRFRDIDTESILPTKSEDLTELINRMFDNPKDVNDEHILLLRTILDNNGITLEDLITQEKQKQDNQGKQEDFSEGMVEVDFDNIIEESDTVVYSNSVRVAVRDSRVLQTTSQVFIKGTSDTEVTIYHLTPEGLMETFGVSGNVELIDSNGRSITVPADQLNTYREPGNKLKGIKFEVAGKQFYASLESANGNIIMDVEQAKELFDNSGMSVYKSAATTTNKYLMVYKEGKPMDSDYNKSSGRVKYTTQDIYQMKPGSKVTFKVDPKDPWNARLRAKYESMKKNKMTVKEESELLNEIRDSVKIQVYDSKGNLIADLKANKETANSTPEFEKIREMGFDEFMNMNDSTSDLGVSVDVEHIFLGLPVLSIKDGKIENNKIDPADVVDQGYFSNGKLVTQGSTQEVSTDLVKRLKKKTVPVVVVRHGKQLIAFPVTMKEKESTFRKEITEELELGKNRAKTVIKIQEKLKEVGLDPKEYKLEYATDEVNTIYDSESSTGYSEMLEKALSEIEERDKNFNFKDWAKKSFDKAELADQAEIAVDLKSDFMTSPKIVLNYESTKFPAGVTATAEASKQVTNTVKTSILAEAIISEIKKLVKRGNTIKTNMAKWKPSKEKIQQGIDKVTIDGKNYLVVNHKSLPERVILKGDARTQSKVALFFSDISKVENTKTLTTKQKKQAKDEIVAKFTNKSYGNSLERAMQKGERVENLIKEKESKKYTEYVEEAREITKQLKERAEDFEKELVKMGATMSQEEADILSLGTEFSDFALETIKKFDNC